MIFYINRRIFIRSLTDRILVKLASLLPEEIQTEVGQFYISSCYFFSLHIFSKVLHCEFSNFKSKLNSFHVGFKIHLLMEEIAIFYLNFLSLSVYRKIDLLIFRWLSVDGYQNQEKRPKLCWLKLAPKTGSLPLIIEF